MLFIVFSLTLILSRN